VDYLQYEHIAVTVLVLVAALTVWNIGATAWQNWRKMRQPQEDWQDKVMNFLASDKARIERLEDKMREQRDSTNMLLKCMLQMMSHEIDGNNTEALRECRDALNKYLVDR